MCGIVGYIGKNEACPILLEGLLRMEYRGYDSAGVVVVSDTGAKLVKSKGRVKVLKEKIGNTEMAGSAGIAHTRWATHGEPSDVNSHPHADCKGDIFVVHNGIIENHAELKRQLEKTGHKFVSETDTEILAHLIEQQLASGKNQEENSLVKAVKKSLKMVIGAYGIAVISVKEPGVVVAAKMGSPLAIGIGNGENVVASDITAIMPITQKVIYLNDGEIAEIRNSQFRITDLDDALKTREAEKIEWTMEAAEKKGFPHFMLKEIFEQPESIQNSIRGRIILKEGDAKLGGLDEVRSKLKDIEKLTIVGMGTARHAGLLGEYILEEYGGVKAEVEYSSEFSYRKMPFGKNDALLAVSQSGETADTLIAVKEAKKKGLLALGVVNATGSSIARETDAGVYNHIGPEIAVASTKAFVSQSVIFALLSVYMGRMRGMSKVMGERILNEIQSLPHLVEKILDISDAVKAIAEKYKHYEHFLFLGRKYCYPVAEEGALKLKEVAYVHAEGYNGGEMKHGPIALIDDKFPVMTLAPTDSVYEKNFSHIQEIKARGGKVIAIATAGNEELKKVVDDIIYIPKTLEMLTPILATIPLQLFAYHMAVARGCDVDKPRNLAKSVTVE